MSVKNKFNHCKIGYSGHEIGSQNIGDPTTKVYWWKAYIPPFGTPVTLDRNGNRVRSQDYIDIYLDFAGYTPRRTHTKRVKLDIIPETKIKTEIINNEY